MSKPAKILILIIALLVIAVIGAYLNSLGFFKSLNQPLNKLVAGEPDKTCNVDSDCIIKETECSVCSNGDVVNEDWKPFCPLKRKGRELVDCFPIILLRDVRCVQGLCQSELAQDDIQNFEDCERAGYPVMESYPRQCRTPDGKLFIETLPSIERSSCGDGVCQDMACLAIGCPPAETPESCPQDCKTENFSDVSSWQTYRNDYFSLSYPNNEYVLASSVSNEGLVIKDIKLGHTMSVHFSNKDPQLLIRYQEVLELRNPEDARELVYADNLIRQMVCEIKGAYRKGFPMPNGVELCAQEGIYSDFDPSMELAPVSIATEQITSGVSTHYQTGTMDEMLDLYLVPGVRGTLVVLITTPNLGEQCANEEVLSSVCEGKFNYLYEDFKKIFSTIKFQ